MNMNWIKRYVSGRTLSSSDPRHAQKNISGALDMFALMGIQKDSSKTFGLYFFEIENFFILRNLYGEKYAGHILSVAENELELISREHFKGLDYCRVERLEPGQFIVLYGDEGLKDEGLKEKLLGMRLHVKSRLKQESLKFTGHGLSVLAGYSMLSRNGHGYQEACVYNAIQDAQRGARGLLEWDKVGSMTSFRGIIENGLIRVHYQPIVDLSSGRIMGWEALSRGPEQSPFASPVALFDFAEEVGQIFDLERVCREKAFTLLGSMDPGQKLFLNIHPRTLADRKFSPGETLKILEVHGLIPENIVFEITERHSTMDFTLFHDTLEHYRGQGYRIAIDDAGSGHSGLCSIAEMKPDFIKIDQSIIKDIDANHIKRSLVETLVNFSEKTGSKIIAEGIETSTELSSLISIGVHYGQGFYLARPAFPKPGVDQNCLECLRKKRTRPNIAEIKCSMSIGELADTCCRVNAQTRVRDVKKAIGGDEEPIASVVVVMDEMPRGLIVSHQLDRILSTQYGMSLYYDRDVSHVMDTSPLIVDAQTPVEDVAKKAMRRERSKIYDPIIVTKRGGFVIGIVSVQKMLDTLAHVQVEMAKGANPLSGLPGNVAIEQEIESRSQRGESFSIIYADLDNFKVYNDVYGFKSGDNVILLFSRILTQASRRYGAGDDFVGHIGGDDFVSVTRPENAEAFCRAVIRRFEKMIKRHYSKEDQARGYINGRDRDGGEKLFPFVSVSLAIVDCLGRVSLIEIIKRSAEVKKYAKNISGNSCVRDRRGPLEP